MTRLVGINHVALEVGDVGEALAFYGRFFDLTLRGRVDGAAFIDIGDQFLALMEGRSGPADRARHFGLVVDDKEPTRRGLESAGVEIRPGRGLDFLDPWGNYVQVVQYDEVQFTKAERVLHGMGLDLGKSEAALEELRAKGLRVVAPAITPHIVVRGAAEAAEWYVRALAAAELSRIPIPDGRLLSVELRFGDSTVRLTDEFPELEVFSPQTIGGTAVVLHLSTDEVDALWQRALDAGAEVLHPLADQFWGNRQGQIADPFGHRWNLSQPLRTVSPDELVRAAAAMFG